jgi:predicted metallopeptidase
VGRFRYQPAPDVQETLAHLVEVLEFRHIDPERIHCRRSFGSTADAYARIWELPSIWQDALEVPPQYIIEVLSEHYDPLSPDERLKTLIHELLHIPRTFSGALRNHRGQGERIDGHTVLRYFRQYRKLVAEETVPKEDAGQLGLPF